MDYSNKVVLVTGAGRGWGRAICQAFARQGATVIGASRTVTELEETAQLVRAQGGKMDTVRLDLSREEEIIRFASEFLTRYHRLDVLVNNAAQITTKTFESMSMAEFDQILTVNLRGPILLTKLFLEQLKSQGRGSIINVSSNSGVRGFENEVPYCASKFGIEGFTRALSLEVKPYNIAVNTITPGGATAGVRIKPTNITQAEYEHLSDTEKEKWADSVVMTEAFLYLGAQDGSGITGERILAYELSDQIRRQGWDIRPAPETLETYGKV